jgi:putative flippase GtrA
VTAPIARLLDAARLCRFAAVGLFGTALYYTLLLILVEICSIPVMTATGLAFIAVVLANYVLHYWWTFRSSAPHATAIGRFVFMSFVGFWLNWLIMLCGVEYLDFGYIWVQAVAIAAVVAWNFTVSVKWIFSRTSC